MLVTIKKASKAERADRITLVELPLICGLLSTRMQMIFPMSPMKPTVFVIIPCRIKVKKMNSGSFSLLTTNFEIVMKRKTKRGRHIFFEIRF